MALFLITCHLYNAQNNEISESLPGIIGDLFSRFADAKAPLLIYLICAVENEFLRRVVSSHLTLTRFGWCQESTQEGPAEYDKVFMTHDDKDRFNLGLFCLSESSRIDRGYRGGESRRVHKVLLPSVDVQSHSFALL